MKASVILSAIASTLAVVYGYNENPVVTSPKNMTYSAGMKIPITWNQASTGFVNIDLVSTYRNVLEQPYNIATAIPAGQGKFEWEIPADLKTAVGYQVRVWGSFQPKSVDNFGNSPLFTIFNDIPNAVNNFIVTSPSKSKPCHVEGPCTITWDFPKTINAPKDVDIVLYEVGNPVPLKKIATVSASDRQYVWEVPSDQLKNGNVFIAVDGTGNPHEVPKMASNMGANSEAFKFAAPLPKIEDTPEYKAQKEKEEAEKKAKEEEEEKKREEEEKEKEEEEKKKREEELKKKQRTQAKNAAASNQVAVAAVACAVMVAALPFF